MEEITIVIPVYNRERLLPRTLASVVKQTYRPLHVILVDNASTDNSMAVLNDFCSQHTALDFRVTVCQEPAKGAPSARNTGLRQATSDWVMFFDSDDEMGPRLVENYVRTIASNPDVDLVYTDMKIIDATGTCRIKRSPRKGGVHFLCGNIFHTYLSTQRYMARRTVLEAVGAWNPSVFGWDDWELGVRLMLHTSRVVKAPSADPQVIVHAHADSITGEQFSDKVDALLGCVDAAEKQVKASGRKDERRLLYCLAYKKVMLAGICHREGSPRGRKLFDEVLAHTESRWVRVLFRCGYGLVCRGVRGSAGIIEVFLRPY